MDAPGRLGHSLFGSHRDNYVIKITNPLGYGAGCYILRWHPGARLPVNGKELAGDNWHRQPPGKAATGLNDDNIDNSCLVSVADVTTFRDEHHKN
jgi:hypothetical protein